MLKRRGAFQDFIGLIIVVLLIIAVLYTAVKVIMCQIYPHLAIC